MKKLLFLLVISSSFLIQSLFCFGQKRKIDSLLTLLITDKADTNKVNHLNDLSLQFIDIGEYDNALKYANKALAQANALIESYKNNAGAVAKGWADGIASAYQNIGNCYNYQGNYAGALKKFTLALKIRIEIGDQKRVDACYNSIGFVYEEQGIYSKAIDNYLKSLNSNEVLKNREGIARALCNIGNIYKKQSDNSKALVYFFKSLKLAEELGNKNGIIINLCNIGVINQDQKEYAQAVSNYFKALKISEALGDKGRIEELNGNIGAVYYDQGDYSKALEYYFKASAMAEELGAKSEIGFQFSNIGELYTTTRKYKEAEQYLKKAIDIEENIGALDLVRQIEEKICKLYDKTARYKLALIHYKKAVALKDTIFSQENKKQLVQKEMQYEFDKKETAAKAGQDKKDAVGEAESKKQKIILGSTAFGLLLVIVFAGFIFRSLSITRKQKNIIEVQKDEVFKQKDIAEELRELSENQKHIVEEKQKEIIQSITYAKRIQTALLTSDNYINTHLPAEHFILFKPKDIVSGDFYWALSIAPFPNWDIGTNKIKLDRDIFRQNIFYMATADCTGHGVPGAFMSMLNISYLNENIVERSIRLPHDILNAQRKEIIQALNPEGSTDESKDGMDCILCAYDFDKMLLHFASANNPLWLIREKSSKLKVQSSEASENNSELNTQNFELIEYKADKMPVGKYSEKMESFTLNTIELQKGDIIYTSTDGFADQFGLSGKKLMKKKFKEELLKIHSQPMAEQKIYLNQFFESWKGNAEQVDDVCVIGIRI